eukprot:CAMPEP_0185758454 /NCGR_PEP_ID=MMETSP1174-20130828/17112_1 /TAXON_ID=35687 /ORGANISM="Dictyocha speculum, Strain CCMP1381" /LENGTH=273 /DNA_ID=CAMNT_0028438315 /DNA_START=284 /DNA_END=1105 /DNA_ORIENTATION=+
MPSVGAPHPDTLYYDTQLAASNVKASGLCHFPDMLDADTCHRLRDHINKVLVTSKDLVANQGAPYLSCFGPVMARADRYDVLLPLDGLVLSAIRTVLSKVEPTMRELVGEDACLCELSALISDPGAVAQPLHHDTSFDGNPPRVSLLVALQDVNEDMGPTLFFPKTNTPEWHVQYLMRGEELEELLGATEHNVGTLKAGDAVLYDTHLLHCASGAEHSGRRRTLLTLSAQEENEDNREGQANIRKGYRGTLKLNQLQEWAVREEQHMVAATGI